MGMSAEKFCNGCLKTLPVEQFKFKDGKRRRRKSRCRKCLYKARANQAYYHTVIKNDPKKLARVRLLASRRHRAKRDELTSLKSAFRCLKCGENDTDALDFHHRDPSTKFRSVGNLATASREVLLREIKKCDLLCARCHRCSHPPLLASLSARQPAPPQSSLIAKIIVDNIAIHLLCK